MADDPNEFPKAISPTSMQQPDSTSQNVLLQVLYQTFLVEDFFASLHVPHESLQLGMDLSRKIFKNRIYCCILVCNLL